MQYAQNCFSNYINDPKMDDPLIVCSNSKITKKLSSKIYNPRGRPDKSQIIQFGPQPMSYISQLLKNERYYNEFRDEPMKTQLFSQKNQDLETVDDVYSPMNHNKKKYKQFYTDKEYFCEYPKCPYKTKLSSNLIKHKRKHTSEKPFLCDQCTFRTNFINSLNVHRRIHTTERPYACKFCKYKCNSSSNLKKHCRHRHKNYSLELAS
ncbi:unnamed protein product [Parnassius apollo]|uniref:(apollo) hypothetical protein n=1 Tax=Parnassius apollo TaxID=110799 RepID=A0A8S3XD22_PARAO|nr:unnamed protein product [Parnassius apollo]